MSFALRVDPFAAPKEEDFRQDLNVRLTCPDCGPVNPSLIEEFGSGDLVCGNCGKQSNTVPAVAVGVNRELMRE